MTKLHLKRIKLGFENDVSIKLDLNLRRFTFRCNLDFQYLLSGLISKLFIFDIISATIMVIIPNLPSFTRFFLWHTCDGACSNNNGIYKLPLNKLGNIRKISRHN